MLLPQVDTTTPETLIDTPCPHPTEGPLAGMCCCTCRYRLRDFHHPTTTGKSIMIQRGWICAYPEFEGVHSGWPEHGLCEGWTPLESRND